MASLAKTVWTQKVHLVVTLSKIQLDIKLLIYNNNQRLNLFVMSFNHSTPKSALRVTSPCPYQYIVQQTGDENR